MASSRFNQRERGGGLGTFTIQALRVFFSQQAPAGLILDDVVRRCAALNQMYIELTWLEELGLLGEHFANFLEYLRTEADWEAI